MLRILLVPYPVAQLGQDFIIVSIFLEETREEKPDYVPFPQYD